MFRNIALIAVTLFVIAHVEGVAAATAHAEEASTSTPCTEKGFCQDDCKKTEEGEGECVSLPPGIQCWACEANDVDNAESCVKVDQCNPEVTGVDCWICPDV